MMPKPVWRRVLRDPVCHFAVLGGLLFGLHAVLAADEKPTIRIAAATVDALLEARAAQTQRPQTEKDRQEVIDAYVAEEILLREALRRGVEQAPLIRAQLIEAMRAALSPEPSTPDETALRAYFAEYRDRFQTPPAISLTQVAVADGETLALLDAADEVAALAGRRVVAIRHATREDLVRLLGRETADAIETIGDRRWHGPFRTARGSQYIRIDERRPVEAVVYEQAAARVADAWILSRQQDSVRRQIAELARNYDVVLLPAK